jgi:hypothetical protein
VAAAFDRIIDARPSSFAARPGRMLNTNTGGVVKNGTVVAGSRPRRAGARGRPAREPREIRARHADPRRDLGRGIT